MPPTSARDRLIVALDFPSSAAALALVARVEGRCLWFKVGLELYLAAGPSIVRSLRGMGFEVFLDLKLHDIPNTVAGAVTSLASSGASLLTVHTLGGPAMLDAAQQALQRALQPDALDAPRLLGVTVLTSMDSAQLAAIGLPGSPVGQVARLAALAQSAGLAGVVCSPQEIAPLRAQLSLARPEPPEMLLVVPGIRPAGAAANDQSRTATPAAAIAAGASMLVIGRPITQAPDPAAAVDSIFKEMEAAARTAPAS